MRDHFRIGLTREFVTLILKPRTNGLVVLNDAVMHQTDEIVRKKRMSIPHGRSTVRRPARMRNAGDGVEAGFLSFLRELRNAFRRPAAP